MVMHYPRNNYCTYSHYDNNYEAERLYLQRKLYYLLEQLQDMAKEMAPNVQQRVSNELLSSLANCLLHDTMYDIVKGLMEVQHVTEKHLQAKRINLTKQHRLEIAKMAVETSFIEVRRRKKIELQKRHRLELKEMDKLIILHLDEKVAEQQLTLQLAGVPGFQVTKNPIDLMVQMHLLDFILRLSVIMRNFS